MEIASPTVPDGSWAELMASGSTMHRVVRLPAPRGCDEAKSFYFSIFICSVGTEATEACKS